MLSFKIILPIWVLCFTLSLAARALGTTQPPNPALRGFRDSCEDQPKSCWNGIIPGRTTAEKTFALLSRLGYEIDDTIFGNTRQLQARLPDRADCGQITANVDQRIGVLYEFYVHPCEMELGEFFSAFGTPEVANLEHEPCSIRLLFMDNQIQVMVANTTRLPRYIVGFGLLSEETVQFDLNRDPDRLSWSGTLPLWKYKTRFGKPFKC